ncbi:hypothetical protein Tco_1102860 [Tanacetum coccineum]
MRTRRSKAGTVTPFANPERQFQARREVSPTPIHNIYTFYESESSESDTKNVYFENLTLEQYLALDQNNTRRRFTCPDDSTFEIKGQLLRELCKISFSGGPTDIVVEHISNVLDITRIFNAQESTLVQVFPLTLVGIAKRWFERTSTKCTKNWSDLKQNLLGLKDFMMILELLLLRHILEENKEPTTTHDEPKQQRQKVVSHEIKESPTHYSVTRQNRLPPKETDPGSFIIPFIIGNHFMSNALADLGASISIMPYSLFKRLELGSLKAIKMTIEMADRSMQSPKGIKENVLVKISNFVFLVDFVVLDIMEDENVLIILGRPMLATAHAKIDVYGEMQESDKKQGKMDLNCSISINRGLIQAFPTLLPPQLIGEVTKASNLRRIPPGVQVRSHFTYLLDLIVNPVRK